MGKRPEGQRPNGRQTGNTASTRGTRRERDARLVATAGRPDQGQPGAPGQSGRRAKPETQAERPGSRGGDSGTRPRPRPGPPGEGRHSSPRTFPGELSSRSFSMNTYFNSLGFLPRGKIAGFIHLRNFQTIFQITCTILYSHQQYKRILVFHKLKNTFYCLIFFLILVIL